MRFLVLTLFLVAVVADDVAVDVLCHFRKGRQTRLGCFAPGGSLPEEILTEEVTVQGKAADDWKVSASAARRGGIGFRFIPTATNKTPTDPLPDFKFKVAKEGKTYMLTPSDDPNMLQQLFGGRHKGGRGGFRKKPSVGEGGERRGLFKGGDVIKKGANAKGQGKGSGEKKIAKGKDE